MHKNSGLWMVALAALCWGTVGIAVQFLYNSSDVSAVGVGFYRMTLALPALFVSLWVLLGKRSFKIALFDLLFMLLMGVMLASYQLFYFASIARVGVAIATLITLCTAPIIVALLAWLFLKEQMTRRILLALLLALLGTVLLSQIETLSASLRTTVEGVLLALGSATGYALVALISRRLAKRYHPLQSITVAFAFGSLVYLPVVLSTGLSLNFSTLGWLALIYIGLVPTAFAYTIFILGMRTVSATIASIVTLLEPLTATLLAWLLFAERLGVLGLLGGVLLLAAILILAAKPPNES